MKKIGLTWVLVSFFSLSLQAKLLIHPNEIMKSKWGDQVLISPKTIFLSAKDKIKIKNKFKIDISETMLRSYKILSPSGALVGEAMLFSDKVRTKNMTLLLLLNKFGQLEGVEVVAFSEPMEYKPSKKWLDKNYGRVNLSEFSISKKSANISGATLSAHSVYKAAKTIASVWLYLKGQ